MGPDKNRLIEVREKKLREWMEKEGNPYWVKFSPDHSTQKIRDKYGNLKAGEGVDIEVRLGGRIVAQRGHGKAMFCLLYTSPSPRDS